jgi:molybdenum cofactor cytidylyltransferase
MKAIILLAAGGSRRMGSPKQLLPYQGKHLIQIVVERLLACGQFPTVVVLGAYADAIAPTLQYPNLSLIQNPNWNTGIASSIRCGLAFLDFHFPEVSHVLFALGDQPMIQVEQYYAMLEKSEEFPMHIIAAQYAGIYGAPMIFPRAFFPQLDRLSGDQGAGRMVRDMPEKVIAFPLPTAENDRDFPEDETP